MSSGQRAVAVVTMASGQELRWPTRRITTSTPVVWTIANRTNEGQPLWTFLLHYGLNTATGVTGDE